MAVPGRFRRSKSLRKAQAVRHPRIKLGASGSSRLEFGAVVQPGGDVRFRLWAPGQERVLLDFPDLDVQIMERLEGGVHEAVVACEPGTRYRYRFPDGRTLPDPASRCQDGDVHGLSCVVDPAAYGWTHPDWQGRPWHETVLYEIHPGLAGGFDGVRRKLPGLAQLGITAIELMPVAEFPGVRSWGYDGVLPYAPDESYGTPDQLRQLVDAAHGLGMQVFLDVVYNHFGPEGNYLSDCIPEFFRSDIQTPWGDAIDYRRPQVRAFFTENALYWLHEYRFDGLRLDAVHAIAGQDWLPELADTVRREFDGRRQVHLVLENDDNDAALLERGFDAQWNDDAHHVVHHLLTGETDGYYAAYEEQAAQKLCRALSEGFVYQGEPSCAHDGRLRGTPSAHLPGTSFVFFLQNHDQTGNRAYGERLRMLCASRPDALNAAIALQLMTPHVPLIFMGEERGATRPFLYFTDFGDTDLIEAVRQGRRREFQRFAAYAGSQVNDLPEPNDEATWERSNPYADPVREDVYRYYTELLRVRHQFVSPYMAGADVRQAQVLGAAAVMVRWRLDNNAVLSVYCNLSEADCMLPDDLVGVNEHCIFTSRRQADVALHAGRLAAEATVTTLIAGHSGPELRLSGEGA